MNRLVVVSNRVPVPAAGTPPGGLAVALEGLMREQGGLWLGWSGDISSHAEELRVTDEGRVRYATVDLTREEHAGYYNGYSNGVLWPLLHSMPELMNYVRRDALIYRQVNERFARLVERQIRPTDIIWIHDYHLLSMPALLRAHGVRAPIGFFLHIPFPPPDVLGALPDAAALTRDLLAADLIGFQTENDLANFVAAAQRHAGASRATGGLALGGRRIRLDVFPVEIEPREFAAAAEQAWRSAPAERLRRSLAGQQLILGVDRLDPTKGLLQRLAGYRALLETRPEWQRRVSFLQIAPVSRSEVGPYRELRRELEREAGSINADLGEPDWLPLRIITRPGARATIAGYMREARVGLVTPLRDGMNLVAKEFVAAQDPQDPGVLVLSRFAGAAQQLQSALLVNPHDTHELAEALHRALTMSLAERTQRWNALWAAIADRSPMIWGRSFLNALIETGIPAAPRPSRGRLPAEGLAPRPADPITLGERPPPLEPRRTGNVRSGGKPPNLI